MNNHIKLLRNKVLRWVLLMIGLGAIIALTGMNVYSLYNLRTQMIEGEEEQRIGQMDEIHTQIRRDLYYDLLFGFSKIELEPIEATFRETGQFSSKLKDILKKASGNIYYEEIYYTPGDIDPCNEDAEIYIYNDTNHQLKLTKTYPERVCDGVGLSRTKTKIQINDINNRWNNNIEFDAHRSMNLSLINLTESRIIGYLTFVLDEEQIANELIAPLLNEYFGEESGVVVWLYNWISNDILATNNPSIEFEKAEVDYIHQFPHFLNHWHIRLTFLKNPIANIYDSTLVKNFVVLGVAVLFLGGALIFMFITAQRERGLAQLQANFLANVTHELKTPLAVMQAAGENISDGRVTEEKRLKQYGQHIYEEAIRLRRMIEKLLDVAKVDSGQIMINVAPNCLHNLVNKYITENREYLEGKGFQISFKSKDEESLVKVDEDSLETILNNLTDNAVKYSNKTKAIHFGLHSEEEFIYLTIRDEGIGIPKKSIDNIFNKFFRVEDSLKAKTKGHGLGLSIVKNMVDLNGGEITVQSMEGKGTTFIIRFPKLLKHYSAENIKISQTDEKIIKSTEYAG